MGDKVVEKANEKVNNMNEKEKLTLKESFDAEFRHLASVRELSPESEVAQLAIDHFFHYLNDTHGNIYSLEAFAGLGKCTLLMSASLKISISSVMAFLTSSKKP